MRHRRLAVLLLIPALLVACGKQDTADSEPSPDHEPPGPAVAPNVPDAETARAELDALTVEPEGPMTDYERELFPHWSEDQACSTRETVLKRDGTDVTVGSDCYPTAGSWYSPYDGVTLEVASDVDIDHVVPLAEAWRSGAASWSTEEREAFANDLEYPELLATSADSNRSKGDQDPADWLPMESYHCEYGRMWVRAKHRWELSVDEEEKTALRDLLDAC